MRIVADQMVPDSISRFLRGRRHYVRLVREELTPTAPDLLIAKTAHLLGAVVITWNVKHFRRYLCRAPRGEAIRFRHAGLISMTCKEPRGPLRVEQTIEVIEFEFAHLQTRPDKRLFIEIGESWIRIER
jgi:hypothetical protein